MCNSRQHRGEARSKMTVDDLLEKFRENAGKALDNDRILLSKVEANNLSRKTAAKQLSEKTMNKTRNPFRARTA